MEKCHFFGKMPFFGFLKPMFSFLRKACLLYKTWKTVFSRFISAIYDMGIEWVTRGYRGLKEVARNYKG